MQTYRLPCVSSTHNNQASPPAQSVAPKYIPPALRGNASPGGSTEHRSWRTILNVPTTNGTTIVPARQSRTQLRSPGPRCPPRPQQPVTTSNKSRAAYKTFQPGTICWMPRHKEVQNYDASDAIFSHPDFMGRPGAFGHPCVVIGAPNKEGRVLCMQITAFSDTPGGLTAKYPDVIYGNRINSRATQRMRWLNIKHTGASAVLPHDGTPCLQLERGGLLRDQSYVNTEKAFSLPHSLLRRIGDLCLDHPSVKTIVQHHNSRYSAYVCGLVEYDPTKSAQNPEIDVPGQAR